jgi:hypothetical protein
MSLWREAAVSTDNIRRSKIDHQRSKRPWNLSPIHWGSFTIAIGLRAIVEPLSTPGHNDYPVQAGWLCRFSWKERGCRHGGYGQGMPQSRKKIYSRPEVTHGAKEGLGDRNASTAMCRTPIKAQRPLGSAQT